MAVSVATLVTQTRLVSGLRNNQLFSDAQIASLLSDAYADMRDVLIVRFVGWFSDRYAFTLTGGNDGYTLDLSLIPLLESVQGLDFIDASGNRYTVDELSSIANRNDGMGVWPLGSVGLSFSGALGRRYWIDGSTLRVVPPVAAQGSYELIYSPMALQLSDSVVASWALTANATVADNGSGFTRFSFGSNPGDHPPLDDAMIGGTITVAIDAPDAAYSVTDALITGPMPLENSIDVDVAYPGGSPTPPLVGTATITNQPAGTVGELPQPLTPWAKYLVLFASEAIRTSRQQDAGAITQQKMAIRQRMIDLTKQRGQGVHQAPITRGWRYGGAGGGWTP